MTSDKLENSAFLLKLLAQWLSYNYYYCMLIGWLIGFIAVFAALRAGNKIASIPQALDVGHLSWGSTKRIPAQNCAKLHVVIITDNGQLHIRYFGQQRWHRIFNKKQKVCSTCARDIQNTFEGNVPLQALYLAKIVRFGLCSREAMCYRCFLRRFVSNQCFWRKSERARMHRCYDIFQLLKVLEFSRAQRRPDNRRVPRSLHKSSLPFVLNETERHTLKKRWERPRAVLLYMHGWSSFCEFWILCVSRVKANELGHPRPCLGQLTHRESTRKHRM